MQFSKLLRREYGISPDMTRGFFHGGFNDCLEGKAELGIILPPFLKEWGWKGSVNDFIHLWLITDHVIDTRVIDKVRSLRQKGIICCLATSQELHRAEYMKFEMGFRETFDHLFFSCEIGWQKPDQAFFEHIENFLQIKQKINVVLGSFS